VKLVTIVPRPLERKHILWYIKVFAQFIMPVVMILDLSPPHHAPKNKRKFHETTAPGSV
jgi:hypothetical protein